MTALAVTIAALVSIGLATVGYEIAPKVHRSADQVLHPTVQALIGWDGGWYGRIATEGYWYVPGRQSPVAFFPAYPLLIRGAMTLGANRWIAAIALSLLCGAGAILLFERWARLLTNARTALIAALLLALYPFAIYLYGIAYSDSLFLALAVGAFLALERRQIALATLLGALATGARPVAPAVVVGLVVRAIELRQSRGERVRAIDFLPVLAAGGAVAYACFLGARFGDPLAFVHVQGAPGWDQAPGWHTWLKVPWFEAVFMDFDWLVAVRLLGHAAVTAGALALVVPTWKRLGWGYAAFVAVGVGMPALASKDFQGLGRYLLAAFPLFLTLALLLAERPRLLVGWLLTSEGLLAVLALAFGAGAYVA